MLFLGLQTNLLESWLPLGAVLTAAVAVVGAVITFLRFMARQERKIDTLARDLKDTQQGIQADISALKSQMEHRFERLEDRNQSFVTQREFYAWIDKLRSINPSLSIPSPFDRT